MATPNPEHECEFVVEPPDDPNCPICFRKLLVPHLLSCCGHHLCGDCVTRIQGDNKPCPLCQEGGFTTLVDRGKQRKILELKVRCSNHNLGCRWEGKLRHVNEHVKLPAPEAEKRQVDALNGCPFQVIECRNKCGKHFQRQLIQEHANEKCSLRPFNCEHCGTYSATHNEVVNQHWPVCGAFPVLCPNECGTKMPRSSVEEHTSKHCQLQVIECEFSSAGCTISRSRKDMKTHVELQINHHNSLLLKQNVKFQKRLEEQAGQLERLTAEVHRGFQEKDTRMVDLDLENQALKEEMSRVRQRHQQEKKEMAAEMNQRKLQHQHERETLRNEIREEAVVEFQALKEEFSILKQKVVDWEKTTKCEEEAFRETVTAENHTLCERISELTQEQDHKIAELRQHQRGAEDALKLQVVQIREASQKDIHALQQRIQTQTAQMEEQQTKTVQGLRQEISQHRSVIQNEVQAIRREIDAKNGVVEGEIDQLKQGMQQQEQELGKVKQRQQQTADNDLRVLTQTVTATAQDIRQVRQQQAGTNQQVQQAIAQLRTNVSYMESCITPVPPFHFTVSRYKERKEPFISDPFYSNLKGYKFRIRVDSKPDGAAVYSCLQRGEHDDNLQWPFRGKIHIRLRKQKADDNHLDGASTYGHDTPDTHAMRVTTGDKAYLKQMVFAGVNVIPTRTISAYLEGNALDFEVTKVEM